MNDERSVYLFTTDVDGGQRTVAGGTILRYEQKLFRDVRSTTPTAQGIVQVRGILIEEPTAEEVAAADANLQSEPDHKRPS